MPKFRSFALGGLLPFFFCLGAATSQAQTAFLDFNTIGDYTNNFNPWNDNGGVNAGNYDFEESTNDGVGGSGGVSVYQATDTTATYKAGSWNFATNGSTIIVSTLIYAAGGNNGDKIQLGVVNTPANGLYSNAGVAFESFRFIPASTIAWSLYEQYRAGNVTTTGGALGNVSVIAGHWYKFVVAMTNTSGATGNLAASCGLFDFGTSGLTPGTNLVTFSSFASHTALDIATNTTVWPAFRVTANSAISAWDNFLVFQSNSPPVITLKLVDTLVVSNSAATFNALADGPGAITYAWYTNYILAAGATGSAYTAVIGAGFTNVMVVARNGNGSATNSATIGLETGISFFNNGANWTINQSGLSSANITGNVFHGTDGGGAEAVTAWFNNPVYINGFVASFTYQDVGGSSGNNADGLSFDLQESGPAYLGGDGGALGISGLTPSADWEVDLYAGNGIGIAYNTDGNTGGYQSTGAINVSSGDPINFAIIYTPGGAVQETLVDTVTGANFTTNYNVGNLTALLGSSNAYVGFSSADGGQTSVQTVSNFSYQTGTNGFTEAVVTNLPATGIQPTTATLAGQILSIGSFEPTVTLYYGPADGGSNPANWENSVTVGVESGVFTQAITGLLPNTTYYYTANAANFAGTSWASPSRSFTTPAVSPPQIANAPATAIGATVATLNGQVLSTGGITPGVILYYDLTDGGTNAGAWTNNVSIGAQNGLFSQNISGLSSNTVYYFTAEATNSQGAVWASPSQSFTTLATNPVFNFVPVLTYHNDNTRWGANTNESILTLANVNTNGFGRLFSYTVDGFVYAQPLIMTNVSLLGKGTHNVVFVVTEHNSVYAFDADDNSGANAAPLWQTSFINPAAGITTVPNGDVGTSDITPEIGITSTPVIDPVTGTIYVEVKTKEPGPVYVHRLHALDIATGLERTNFNSPSVIVCTNYPGSGGGDNDGKNPPHVLWNPLREHSRPALTLLNGVIYMSFASHGDNQPYHGWFMGYNATNVAQQVGVFNATPNGSEGGFWDAGDGPSVDAQGNLYFQSGNGTFDGGTTLSAASDYAMSLMKFSTTNGLSFVDYFAPSNAVSLSNGDQDLGSAAPIILPDSAGSVAHPHLVVGGGKTSPIYLVDRDNMGRFNGTGGANLIVQEFYGGSAGDRDASPAFFNNTMYIFDLNNRIGAFTITNALFNTTPVETPDGYDNKGGATPCISADGATNAIAWVIYNSGGDSPASPCVLRAYNATNLTQELYSSDEIATRDAAGDAVKFTIPTIANGKVYVGAQYSLTVYGLAAYVNTPVISPNGGVFTNSVTVSLSDGTPGASIYYTLNGTVPTTNSILYTAPFAVTNSGSVTAGAFKTGAEASGTASASFINSSAIGSGTGLLGQYWANTTSAAFLASGFDAPPTLTRVDPTINFNWDTTTPAANIGPDTYVVQWTGSVEPQFNETYTFSTTTDDGVLLWVNGQLLVNEWVDEAPTTFSGQITLQAQQRYNIVMDYYQDGGGAVAQLSWSSPSTGPTEIIPESQLYPVTNPPPSVTLTAPTNGESYTASASVTLAADAAAQYNSLSQVNFYANSTLLGSVSSLPYTLTATGLSAGSYALTAVATDGSGLSSTSAPVNITVKAGSGQPYGLTGLVPSPAFFNMPTAIPPTLPGTVPTLLSMTGVFSNTPAMIPTNGLIPYNPNVALWSDGAAKTRYLSVPNVGSPSIADEQITFAPTGSWTFPAGTVFVKTFQLQTNQSDPNSLRRLETRLLVRDINGAVYGVTYKWRPDDSDADLLTTSSNENIAITTPEGVVTQTWYYPSPADCLTCHTPVANYVLGLSTRQLNGNFTYPSTGVTDNQLRTLNRLGLLNPAIDEAGITNLEQMYALTNTSASLELRARSYLDANCVQCHQPGGSGPTIDARFDTPLTNQNLIYGVLSKGNLGYDNAYVIVPDDIWRSVLYDRIDSLDPTIKMPPLDRNVIDTNAVAVFAAWINSLPGVPALAPPAINPSGGTFGGSVTVNLLPPDDIATLYYTLDGTLPNTGSLQYSGPFTLTNSATVEVNAFEPGYTNSVATTALFTIEPPVYFTSTEALSNNAFQLSLSGTLGASYILQASTNLADWVNLSTNTPTTSLFNLTDTNTSAFPYRFYRVIELP